MVFWDDLGFASNYTIDDGIEYPGDGHWGMPVIEIASAINLPAAAPGAIVRPLDGLPWVLSSGRTGSVEIYGTPDPDVLCLVEQFQRATFVDVHHPSEQTVLDVYPVRIAASPDQGLLLVCNWTRITAVSTEGVRWRSVDLVSDDLHITRADADRIYYRGEGFDYSGELRGSVDSRTGEVITS